MTRERGDGVGDDGDADEAAREAFALLGHDLRLEIVLALLERWRAAATEPTGYADLMRAVGLEDSGKFNYHLQKLRGVYVRKTDEGYVPTAAATALYRAVLGSRPTTDDDVTLDGPDASCPACGTDLAATYEHGFLEVTCPDCGSERPHVSFPLPRNALAGRTETEVYGAVADRVHGFADLVRRGQCPYCAGTVSVSIDPEAVDRPAPEAVDTDAHAVGFDDALRFDCDRCSLVLVPSFTGALAREPRVVATLRSIGVDTEDSPPWVLPLPGRELRSRDPLRVALTWTTDGGTATVVVDDTVAVVSTETATAPE
ncbi:ArsR family transcriptional regulator [Halobaculum sp. MBLA0147]|uniref:DUF7351 domain-containing protein n=1 Tax=Halobaculum sp. MBLA0147 TaxID=3079934 RepID=UPI0035264345